MSAFNIAEARARLGAPKLELVTTCTGDDVCHRLVAHLNAAERVSSSNRATEGGAELELAGLLWAREANTDVEELLMALPTRQRWAALKTCGVLQHGEEMPRSLDGWREVLERVQLEGRSGSLRAAIGERM